MRRSSRKNSGCQRPISWLKRATPIPPLTVWVPMPVDPLPRRERPGPWRREKIKAKARKIAAHLLEVGEEDLEWEVDKWQVKGSPDQAKTIQEIAFAAYTNHPQGMEAGLEATDYYDPPNLTFPFGSYICVVDIDTGTGEVHVRRFVAVGRLRQYHQPPNSRRSDRGRSDDGVSARDVRRDRIRRKRSEPDRNVCRLSIADSGRVTKMGAWQDNHAITASSSRS